MKDLRKIIKEEISLLNEKTDYSKEKDKGLHGWFERQGGKGKSSGWVDCNTCRKDSKTFQLPNLFAQIVILIFHLLFNVRNI